MLRGNPWTFGPDEQGRIMAAGECVCCGAQLSGPWQDGVDRDQARHGAVSGVRDLFVRHACLPGTGLFGPAVPITAK